MHAGAPGSSASPDEFGQCGVWTRKVGEESSAAIATDAPLLGLRGTTCLQELGIVEDCS